MPYLRHEPDDLGTPPAALLADFGQCGLMLPGLRQGGLSQLL